MMSRLISVTLVPGRADEELEGFDLQEEEGGLCSLWWRLR